MRERGSGLVIAVSSRVGRVIIPGLGLYCTSKFALETAMESMHYESTPQGIDFAILQPSAFDTDVNRNARRIYASLTRPAIEAQSPQGAAYHRAFLETLDRNFSGQPSRDPQEVAELALGMALTPRDQRVLRYPVGDERELGPVRTLNGQVASLQEGALRDSGYGNLYRR
jgi:NAD(P)-dependent dehydrogenase (short-subunit alcohol dehydrogenase family)